MIRRTLPTLLLLVPLSAHAEWKGQLGLGALITSGNSETQSLNGKFALDYLSPQWKNSFTATALNNGDDSGRTAERYTAGDKLDYNLDPLNYLFGAVDYEKDLFGGFRERLVESVGYGRHILTGPVHTLDAEIGAGARQTEEQNTGDKKDDLIGRFGGKYQWAFSETSAFAQSLKIEAGEENTFTEAISELRVTVIGSVALSLSFTARNNSDVPPDTKKTDTFTSIGLTYAFAAK